MGTNGRILLIEDMKIWQIAIASSMESAGYEVIVAGNYKQALSRAESEHFDLAILDIRLADADETNRQGIEVLKRLHSMGLTGNILPCVIATAYPETEEAVNAFQEYGAVGYLFKREFEADRFVQYINSLFERLRIDRRLKLILTGGLTYDIIADESDLSGVSLVQVELEGLFRRLFAGTDQVVLSPLARPALSGQKHTGHIIKAEPFYADRGVGEALVVKVGSRSKIEQESQNYERHVMNFVGGGRATYKFREAHTLHAGAIAYGLIGASLMEVEGLGAFYMKNGVASINDVLEDLFCHVCELWYDAKSARQPVDMRKHYFQHLDLHQEDLERTFRDKIPDYLDKRTIQFPGISGDFVNPVYWVKDKQMYCNTHLAVGHGDLNVANVLVDRAGRSWLIDFQRTGQGHILRDFVELETSIKYELLECGDMAALHEFETALAMPTRYSEGFKFENSAKSAELEKAFAVVTRIRELAHTVAAPGDTLQVYYVGLLCSTLNMIRFYRIGKIRRQHALLSAAILCKRLDGWEGGV